MLLQLKMLSIQLEVMSLFLNVVSIVLYFLFFLEINKTSRWLDYPLELDN